MELVIEFVNLTWPIAAIGIGFGLGWTFLNFLKDVGDFHRDDFSPPPVAPPTYTPIVTIQPEHKPKPQSKARACRYCGGEYDGGRCPNCGAPRQ